MSDIQSNTEEGLSEILGEKGGEKDYAGWNSQGLHVAKEAEILLRERNRSAGGPRKEGNRVDVHFLGVTIAAGGGNPTSRQRRAQRVVKIRGEKRRRRRERDEEGRSEKERKLWWV